MANLIKKIPIPFSGLMLATAATGNLLQSYSELFHTLFGAVAFIMFLLCLAKFILYPRLIIEDHKNPVFASVSGAFLMGTFFISVYLKSYLGIFAELLWFADIVAYVVLMIYYTARFVRKLDIKEVYTGYLIVYVGPIAITNTAPAFGMQLIGQIAFWVGFVLLIPTLILLAYRYMKHREIADGLKPLFGIFAAPFSLCLVGYLKSFAHPSTGMIIGLLTFSLIFYLIGVCGIRSIYRYRFFPSFASYTFPFVNSAIALKLTIIYFQLGSFWRIVNDLQIVIAVSLVLYVFVRYLLYFAEIDVFQIKKYLI